MDARLRAICLATSVVSRLGIARSRAWIVLYAVLALYFTSPLLSTGNQLGAEDWDALLFYHASVFKSVYEYGRLPFWNPWYCGGNVLWQNPQVPLLSPVYLLSVAMSLPLAMKLTITLHYFIGLVGTHLLVTRGLRLRYWPAVLFLSCLFTLAGGPVFHLWAGHATFLPYFYLPWILLFFLRAVDSGALSYTVAAGAVIAVAIFNGGIYVTFMFAVALGVLAALLALFRRDWRPLALIAAVGTFAVLFSAPKLLPVETFVSNPRTVDTRYVVPGPEVMSLEMVEHAFLDPFQFERLRFVGQKYGWHEYANYIGSFATLLMIGALLWVLSKPFWRAELSLESALALTATVTFLLALGDIGLYSPYALVRRLPLASQFRLPSRYSLVFVLFASAMVGAVWRRFVPREDAGGSRYVAIVLVIASATFVHWNRPLFEGTFSLPPLDSRFRFLSRPAEPAIDTDTPGLAPGRSPMLRGLAANRGVLMCYEPLIVKGDVNPAKPSVFADGGAMVAGVVFTPGRIQFRVLTGGTTGRVFLNERFVEGWQTSMGSFQLDPDSGLAYIDIPSATAQKVTFSFVPQRLVLGVVLFLVGTAFAVKASHLQLRPSGPIGLASH